MNSSFGCFKANTLFIIALVLLQASWNQAAAGHLDQDMRILRMYCREKDLAILPTRFPKPISQVKPGVTSFPFSFNQ